MSTIGVRHAPRRSRHRLRSGGLRPPASNDWFPPGPDAGGGGIDLTPPCVPWAPAAGPWSSLPTSHPATVEQSLAAGLLRPSATGKHVYTVAAWLEQGHAKRRILRSDDIGASWCLIESPDSVVDVIPAPAQEAVLYAVTTKGPSGQRALLRTSDAGLTWTASTEGLPEEAPSAAEQPILVGTNSDLMWFQGQANAYWSRDGGDSWKPVELPVPTPPILDAAMPNRLFLPENGQAVADVSINWGATWAPVALPTFNTCTGGWPYGCGFTIDSSSSSTWATRSRRTSAM